MSLLLADRRDAPVRGDQTPRILSAPGWEDCKTSGPDVVELCGQIGWQLDGWQQLALRIMLAEAPTGLWQFFEFADIVARQNGKGDVLMAREIGGLFLLGDRTMVHTAHEFKTASEAFRRIRFLIENSDMLRKRCKKPRMTTGQEAIELLNGARLLFLARSLSSGRGFTGDCVIFDEAQILGPGPIDAMMPTLSSVPNPQVLYTGSAGTEASVHLGSVRARALRGEDRTLAYLEHSVDENDYDPDDPVDWAKANPAMGIRISPDYISKERAAMSAEGFARERLGIGTWPSEEGSRAIPADKWHACADENARRPEGATVFALEVDPDRSHASIAVSGRRQDGALAVELADSSPGLGWVVARVLELDKKWQPVGWVIDVGGPAATFVRDLKQDVNVLEASYREVAQASEGFYDGIMDGSTRHTGDVRLGAAVQGAKRRACGDGWAWGRRISTCDIGPLVAASLARWGFLAYGDELGPDDVYVG